MSSDFYRLSSISMLCTMLSKGLFKMLRLLGQFSFKFFNLYIVYKYIYKINRANQLFIHVIQDKMVNDAFNHAYPSYNTRIPDTHRPFVGAKNFKKISLSEIIIQMIWIIDHRRE